MYRKVENMEEKEVARSIRHIQIEDLDVGGRKISNGSWRNRMRWYGLDSSRSGKAVVEGSF
jgi:hypothetical protein